MTNTEIKSIRKIIHIDMDAFYASVEQRDSPALRGKPVIVGGSPNSRGVVSTCSYEAREYGVHSAMASSRAYKLCPHGIFVPHRFQAYSEASEQIRAIFHQFTDLVEPLSLDEAFLDVTENTVGSPYATPIAIEIKRRIQQTTRLTASAGVSFNKFLAKVASDFQKPNGLTVIPPEKADAFIDQLPINKFHGIGRVTAEKMRRIGIKTGAALKKIPRETLEKMFGKSGGYYYDIAHGLDDRPVCPIRIRKSIGKENTFERDLDDLNEMKLILKELAVEVGDLIRRHHFKAKTVTLKVKYHDFQQITRSSTLSPAFDDTETIVNEINDLLQKTDVQHKKVRLLGVSTSNFERPIPPGEYYQPEFEF